MTVVVDASALLSLLSQEDGPEAVRRLDAVAPPLLWSEYTSAVRERAWRGELRLDVASALMEALVGAPVSMHWSVDLYRAAADVAVQLGWKKTYDAEYVALAAELATPLLTVDLRLRRGAARLVDTISIEEALA